MLQPSPSDRRIGIFGGSFNPPHLAHLLVAELISEQFHLDRVVWLTNFQSPLKNDEDVAPARHRLAMTRLAIEGNERFSVSDLEVRRGGISYTIDTIRTLQEAHPRVDFRLIVGSDSLADFDTWREPQEILDRVRLVIFRRPASEAGTSIAGFEDRIDYADAPLFDVSATVIRSRIRAHKSIRYMVPESVRSYILEHGLYTSAESASTVT